MSLATTVKESKLQRRMYTQQALMYRQKGDREGVRVFLNAAKTEVLNQRYFLGRVHSEVNYGFEQIR